MSKNQVSSMMQKIDTLQRELARLATQRGISPEVLHIQKLAAEIDNECQDMYLSALHIPIAQRVLYRCENPYI